MAKVSADTRINILNDHYKETNLKMVDNIKSRDRTFSYMLIVLAVMSFQLFSPKMSDSLINQLIHSKLNINVSFSFNYISSLIWFALLAVSIRYFQAVINLEKLFNYVHKIESEIAEGVGDVFSREGKAYLKNFPMFSEWMHILYRLVFPILLLIAVTIKIVSEWRLKDPSIFPLFLNTSIYLMIIISTVLYIYSLAKTEKDTEETI